MDIFKDITRDFYQVLRREVLYGNPYLTNHEQNRLQLHHDVIMNTKKYPPSLASIIYVNRRSRAVQAILAAPDAMVFDAGSGFGSDSFLFAALGAKVLAVDISPEQIAIARKRKLYFEQKVFGRELAIDFEVADLKHHVPEGKNFSLTWIASVLAVLPDQKNFLQRVYAATRAGGQVMVTDMNLRNPWFLFKEWRRRQRAKGTSPEFACQDDFWGMVRRRGRSGAIFFPLKSPGQFDDAQFFTAGTLGALLRQAGFRVAQPGFSGFVFPHIHTSYSATLESFMAAVPILNNLGYFYSVTGIKHEANEIIP
jgi:SAM-dependent methyltransferase